MTASLRQFLTGNGFDPVAGVLHLLPPAVEGSVLYLFTNTPQLTTGQQLNTYRQLVSNSRLFNLIMQTISAFMTFVPAFIISKGTGDPMDGTLLYSLYLFVQVFSFFNMGYASAMAWIMLIFVGLLTGIIFLTSKFWVHYE